MEDLLEQAKLFNKKFKLVEELAKKNTDLLKIIMKKKKKKNNNLVLKCKKIDKEAKIFTRKHFTDAGMDVYSLNDISINPYSYQVVKTGITVDFLDNTVAFVWPKSRSNFLVGAGVIDSSYQGEILIKIFNILDKELKIKKHQGIAQIVITPVLCPLIKEVDEIHQNKTERGETGGISGNSE